MKKLAATLAVVALLFSAGSAWADFDDGMAAAQRGDCATALREFLPLAEQGDAGAQYNLGVFLENGYGVPENDAEAVKWYRKAAYANTTAGPNWSALAQYNLGVMYSRGVGVSRNYTEAVKWYRKAADQGHEGSKYRLRQFLEAT